jgi:hypothetical protein
VTTNAELAQQVRQLSEQVEQLGAGPQVKTLTATDDLTGQKFAGPALVLAVDEQAGVACVVRLSAWPTTVPLDQLK